jgi:hypothetical protein
MNVGKLFLLIFVVFVMCTSSAISPPPNYTIENNTVFIDDTNVYLSATPHTISSSGWVYFNLTSKLYTGDIDAAWGFNTSVSKPTRAELYNPHWVNTTSNHEHTFYNVTFYAYSGSEFDYGNVYNLNYNYTVKHEVPTYNETTMEPDGFEFIFSNVAFDSFLKLDDTNYTTYWHDRHDKYVLWEDFTHTFNSMEYDHEGYDKWYYIKNIPVISGQNYNMRAWVEVPVSLEKKSGKYYFAVKPSFETIQEAVANGDFYALDPWWNSSWNYYKTLTPNQTMINQTIDDGIFPMYINITDSDLASKAQADGDDIVFTNAASTTQLDHQIVGVFNSTTGHLQAHVNVTDISNVSSINMYYNNSGATNTENPSGVWGVNASAIWLMDEGTGLYANDSSGNGNNGTLENGVAWGSDGLEFDGVNDYIRMTGSSTSASLNSFTEQSISVWVKFDTLKDYGGILSKWANQDVNRQFAIISDNAGKLGYYISADDSTTVGKMSTNSLVSAGVWYYLVFTWTPTAMTIYVDGVEKETFTTSIPATLDSTSNRDFAVGCWGNTQIDYSDAVYHMDGSIDSVHIHNRALSADEIATQFNNTNSPELFISVGAEQTEAAEDTTPPASITSLTNTTGNFWHNWTWTNPVDADFNHTMIYLNNVFTTNVSNTTEFYNYTVSAHNTSTISTHTVDITGNINTTWVNHTSVIPNNPITISNISATYNIDEGDILYIDAEYSDADGDTPTFADNSTEWNVNTSTGVVSWQTADGDDGTYHWQINVSDGYGSIDTHAFNVTVNNSIYPPTVELLSQTPSVLYQNSTGNFSLIYGIAHSTAGLNNSSIAFKNTMWDIVHDHYNLSIRPPNNDKAAYSVCFDEYILRGNNRNETLNFENNVTITEGNIWKWSGMDENCTELTIEVINSTYTKVHINTLIHDHVFSNMWYLDRSTMQEAPKTQYSIYKDHGALIKFWDAEAAVGHVHLGCAHLDTGLGAVEPTPANPIEVWYVNKSYNPAGSVAVEDSPYAFYMTSMTKDDWVDHVYTPHVNSSYARCITINSTDIENSGVNVTDIAYLYLTSQTNNNRPFYLNMTNVSSGTNVSFADTNVMWSGTAPFAQVNYTPNLFITMIHDNYQYQAKLYTADNDDLWGNSTLHTSNVEVSIFPPTKPSIHHILYNGVEYQNSAIDNQTFNGVVDVAVAVSTDPDGGTVTHNLTLHYKNETLAAIINNTFTEPTNAFAEIEFNTTTYYSYTDEYTLRVIATDDDGDNQTTWLGYNFTLYVTDEPTNLQNTTGNHWVNFTWDPGANTDAYNVTFNGTWYNSSNASINHSVGAHGWGNITVWAWNDSSGMSASSISDNVQVPNNAPVLTGVPDSNTNEDVPINNAFDLDTYFSDADGDSPSYSVHSNNQTGNITPSIDGNNVVSYSLASNWYGVAEIVYKVEDGYGANDTDTVIVTVSSVNDQPVLQPIGPQNVNEGQTVTIEVAGTDVETPEVDLDFTCNRTDLFTDFSINGGWTEWITNYSQAGVYHVLFTVSDGTDSDNETVVITVTNIPLIIDSYWNNQTGNSLSLSIDTGTTVAFEVTTNRTANTTWYNHSIFAETDTDTTQANYTATFASAGTFYINVSSTDGIDQTANTTFTVEVSVPAVYYDVSGYVFDTNATVISGATVSNNQTVGTNVTNVSGYYILSLENGSVLITATAIGYVSNYTVATVAGDTANQNITLVASPAVEEQDNTMPLPLFITWMLILFVLMFTAYPKRDEYEDFDIGVKNVTASFISIILSFTLSKVVINGQLVQVFSGISSTDVVITGTTVIQISWLGWLFSFIGISMVLLLVMCLVSLYKDIYGDVTDE